MSVVISVRSTALLRLFLSGSFLPQKQSRIYKCAPLGCPAAKDRLLADSGDACHDGTLQVGISLEGVVKKSSGIR